MIQVGPARVAREAERVCVGYRLQAPAWAGLRLDALCITYPAALGPPENLGDAAVLSLLPFAFWVGAQLRLDRALAVTPHAHTAAAGLCRQWGEWYRRPFNLRVTGGTSATDKRPSNGKTALFFSGGVDSQATFLQHRDEIDSLVFVRGADPLLRPDRLNAEAKYALLESRLRDYAEATGKEFIAISTNVREVFDFRYRGEIWAFVASGPAMVAPFSLFQEAYARVWIASGGIGVYEHEFPHGTQPKVVQWLANSRTAVSVREPTAARFDKLRRVAEHPGAVACLRVCSEEVEAYNCGECEKCCLTIAGLLLCRVQAGTAPFAPTEFNLKHVASRVEGLEFSFYRKVFWSQILAAMQEAADLPPGGQQLKALLSERIPDHEAYLVGRSVPINEPIHLKLPGRPNWAQRLIGYPALNHGSFRKWLAGRVRATFGKQRVRTLLRDRASGERAA